MKKKLTGIPVLLACFIMTTTVSAQTGLTKYVDPMIGTAAHGHTYPGASLPFSMVQLSPDTDIDGWDWCSGYHYSDNSIMGFSHTHLSGTGCADYGDILFMPTTGELKTQPGLKNKPGSGYRSKFSHSTETAKPGYYSVQLEDYNIKAELTAARRAGFHRYIFPKTNQANIIIDLIHGIQDKTTDSEIKIIDNKTISGSRRSTGWANDHTVYFYAEFSKPFKSAGIVENGSVSKEKKSASGKKIQAFVEYSTASGEAVMVKVGISHTSPEGAKNNLKKEIPGWNFAKIQKQASDEWEKELSKITVSGDNSRNKTVFYTALYHSLLNPNTLSDADGHYTGMDRKIHSSASDIYTVFSLWDTFRAAHPLFTIIDSQRDLNMVRSLISKYDECGELPVWELASNETGTMIGYHSIPVITDAYFKGIREFDVEKAYTAMKNSAMLDKNGLVYYKSMGYIPSNLESESASKTLEYAYDDWCIAKMAKALGKTEDYNYFIERAKSYSNIFDPSTCLMRPKKNSRWLEPFDPYSVSGNYTEANSWQYSFFVPQDVNGLIKLMNGDENFVSKLDELFTANPVTTGRQQSDITGLIGQYAHGNEPSHHMAYLYNYAGKPWKTQERVHEVLTTLYTEKPDGLCGNEDCGQMSAWFVLSAAGFYPVCPGDDAYVIGTPLFNKTAIKTSGKLFTIKANNLSDKNYYIQSAKLNGKDYTYSYIRHSDLTNGGELVLEMDSKPGSWGSSPSDSPTSFINSPFVVIPAVTSGQRVFSDSVTVGLKSAADSTDIYFTVDGTDPIVKKNLYHAPITMRKSFVLKAVSSRNGKYSKTIVSEFNRANPAMTIKLNTQYSPIYPGNGALGLIDSIKGTTNFRSEAWLGYEGTDLDAVVDLGSVKEVSSISTRFLQSTPSWIFFPSSVEYFVSADGIDFTKIYETSIGTDTKDFATTVKEFEKNLSLVRARFVRVYAKNVGICPESHQGAGNKAWLFTDEITIK